MTPRCSRSPMAASSAARPSAPPGETHGEVVFNTSMTGYQEILTDPSYRGQIVCMTYPADRQLRDQPRRTWSRAGPGWHGFIVKEACPYPSSWRGQVTLDAYLARARHRRHPGHRHARAHPPPPRPRGAGGHHLHRWRPTRGGSIERARALPGLVGRDLVSEVSVDAPHGWIGGHLGASRAATLAPAPARFRVVAFDSGIKQQHPPPARQRSAASSR